MLLPVCPTRPQQRKSPLGPMNELHKAAGFGSTERTVALLARGVIDIDERTPEKGFTPLIVAAGFGYSHVVRILLNNGANTSLVSDDGFTALHLSAEEGHLAVTKLLVKAGADLEAKDNTGSTPLDVAAEIGHSEVMGVLIEAGANPNSRRLTGLTPLFSAAHNGHVDATKVLLRAKANPLLTFSNPWGSTRVPLDAAAEDGHLEVVHELIREHGIEGCGGASGGVDALEFAAKEQQVDMMGMLTSAGVVDTGIALIASADRGQESSVKFLLQQEWKASGRGAGYLDTCDRFGATPLVCSIMACRSCSPRIARLLVDAGADTTTAVRITDAEGSKAIFNDTPLALADLCLSAKEVGGKEATESQLHRLEATRRLLMRTEAVHAVSWLWASDVPSTTHAATEGTGKTEATPTPLISMLLVLRRRSGRPRVLLAALFRHSGKPY